MSWGTRGGRPPAEFVFGMARRHARSGRMQITGIEEDWNDADSSFRDTVRPPKRQSKEPVGSLQRYSITRPINIASPNTISWLWFVTNLADRNNKKGEVPDVASLGCEYVNGDSLQRMLADGYPKAFASQDRAHKFQKEYATRFNQHMRSLGNTRTEAVFGGDGATTVGQGDLIACGDDLMLPTSSPDVWEEDSFTIADDLEDRLWQAESDAMLWGHGDFAVHGLDKFGRAIFGADLRDNEELYTEWNGIRDYLRQDGLDLSLIANSDGKQVRSFEPHIKVFETATLGGVALTYMAELPGAISLHPPSMRPVPAI